jgi:hypothetical protein
MNAIQFGDQISLIFTKVMDAMQLGMPAEDESLTPSLAPFPFGNCVV